MADYADESPSTGDPDKDLISAGRRCLKELIDDEATERAKMLDDMRFAALDQWPSEIRMDRQNVNQEGGPRPCLTIDKYSQYEMQVVNDMRQGKPGINVRPQDDSADVETAKVLKGLVRNIEDQSNADIAYSTAGTMSTRIGLGFFRIVAEYVGEDSFDQELFIRPLPNTFAVYLGHHIMPDGSDAREGFIVETMAVEKFKSEFPGKKWKGEEFSDLGSTMEYWHTGETVTVVERYYFERTRHTLYFLADGTTITEEDYKKWPLEAGPKPTVQDERTTFKDQLKWCKMTGVEILEKRDLPGKWIPIVEVIGRESNVNGRRVLWGLVRPAKDSLRMYNYFASTITEKMGLAPKAPFVGAKGQFEGLEDKWKKANQVNYAYLEYNAIDVNGNAIAAPQRQGPTPMEAALLNQMQVIEHDVQTSLGMFKAATGESESQQSGRAIMALQRESDTGTYHFGANLGVSIRHAGRILVDLIPHYYDTKRVVRIIGEDGEVKTAQLDPEQETSYREVQEENGVSGIYNPGVGKYDVSISVGPSYNTKRMEDQAVFVEMSKGAADPASAATLRYLVMRNSDNPGAQEAAKLLKALLPPQALQALYTQGPIPPQVQAQMLQMQAQMQAMQEEGQKLQEENAKLKSGAEAQMAKVQVDAAATQQKAQVDTAATAEQLRLQREKQEAEILLARQKAEAEATLAREKAEAEAQLKRDTAVSEHGLAMKKVEFERDQKLAADPEFKDKAMLPQVMGGVEDLGKAMAKGQEDIAAAIKLMAEAISKPKTVRLGGIQRGAEGITGASATVQ